ncbi:hypothetical protein [Bosea sp. RAC05]|uniref:hypothetical protein n=1 Tax=Bosea sp. RAC05 TaxID=1842539 RepID=UPI00083DF71A|nr:hypothetical protein [Bosea sp. RAC05]AOG02862.1 hypothetical protein BSY19_4930 [Bosea sp. RAC05]
MFNLIIAAIVVVVIAILTIASIFYGGNAFSLASDKGRYAQYINHGEQIAAAIKLYQIDKGAAPSGTATEIVQILSQSDASGRTYLSSSPVGDWYVTEGIIYRKLLDNEECKRMNTVAGKDVSLASASNGCPPCDDAVFSEWPACARTSIN